MRVQPQEWKDFVQSHPNVHLLQTTEWGELKSAFGWKAVRLITQGSGAQLLLRSLPGGFTIGYIPKGPIGSSEELWNELDHVCKQEKTIFLKIEPDDWEDGGSGQFAQLKGWIPTRSIQPRRTVVLSLQGTEEDILARMKQKTRYNIRLAEKKGVEIRSVDNVAEFHRMSEITAKRDGFGVHSATYYQKAFDLFKPLGQAELLMAYYQDRPLAGLMVFGLGDRAWYMYGASNDEERNRMPAYLIQWEAMKWAISKGCKTYDLWGIPDVEEATLEDEFSRKESHDGLWGVYRFKRGFGGSIMRSQCAYDKIYQMGLYKVYQLYSKLRGRAEE